MLMVDGYLNSTVINDIRIDILVEVSQLAPIMMIRYPLIM